MPAPDLWATGGWYLMVLEAPSASPGDRRMCGEKRPGIPSSRKDESPRRVAGGSVVLVRDWLAARTLQVRADVLEDSAHDRAQE